MTATNKEVKVFKIMAIGLFRGGMMKILVIAAALIAIFSTRGTARLMTECCGDCHVIHAWEDETERERAAERAAESAAESAAAIAKRPTGLYASILEEACEACHADANSHTLGKAGLNTVPIVKNGQEPEVFLAGGNFYYGSGQLHLEKAGGTCTSCHRDVRHHATSSGYRFLGSDVEGIGDPQYEHGEGHNIYKSGDQYCSACHGNFCGTENQRAGEGWIRHPTNTPLPMEGQYETYVYRKDIPVGYPDPSSPDRANAHVMCISCHRPHGTPNPYLLRWDYKALGPRDGKNDNGCFACHRQKGKGT
jgi:predicted CXXCH cytochrome family protein